MLGEGEQPLLDLVNALEAGKPTDNIIGLKTTTNFEQPDTFYQEANLQELPIPEYENTNFEMFRNKAIPVYSNRGCTFRCHFCSEYKLFGKKFKRRTPERVIEDMRILRKKHNINAFYFCDSLLNASQNDQWLEEFVDLLPKNEDKFYWYGRFRAELTRDLINRMKDTGLLTAGMGVESFSQDTLNKMNKKKDEENIMTTIYALIDNNIKASINLFVGYPGEKEENFMETFETTNKLYNEFKQKGKLDHFKMTIRNFELRPYSSMFDAYEKFGITADKWGPYFDEKFHPEELKDVFEKTLCSFVVNDVSINDTIHRLYLLNQIRNKDMFYQEEDG